VFSQNAVTRTIGSRTNVRGFWKVRETATNGKIVVSQAVSAQSAVTRTDYTDPKFYFNGVVISDLPTSCAGKNFIISGYGQTGDALTLINLEEPATDINEITALWTGIAGPLTVSKSRLGLGENDISGVLNRETQTSNSFEIVFGAASYSRYLETKDLVQLVVETQEDTLVGNTPGAGNGDRERDDD
jgi:hypothetical protein